MNKREREVSRAASRAWKQKRTPEQAQKAADDRRDAHVGKGASAHFHSKVREQDGKCAICGEPPPGIGKHGLKLDHNHETGQYRGALCHKCNVALGVLRENPELFLAAIEYLAYWKGRAT